MSGVIIAGNTSGSVTLSAPDVAGTTVITLPAASGTMVATDASGNVGVGTTSSAWGSTYKAVQVGVGSSLAGVTNDVNLNLTDNAYYNGTNWIYIANSPSERYRLNNGQHQWFNSPSGTAGNAVSYTQAMTLDASGNLLVGAADTAGSLSNATSIVGGLFSTFNGSASSASGVVTNFATLPNVGNGLFLVSVGLAASAVTTYNPTALIRTSGTNAAQTNLSTATTASISLSGLTVRFTQSSGGTNGWTWSIIRLS